MTQQQDDLIVAGPDMFHGQARVRGTRIPVSVVLPGSGLGEDEILRQYPTLTIDGVRALPPTALHWLVK